jgi:hypothetical protein
MTFTEKQKKGDMSIELKLNDLSKREPHVPITSDEALYEISMIKEEITNQLVRAVKETSIDCAIYSKHSKEGLHCLTFGENNPSQFSYVPDIERQQKEGIMKLNKKEITWEGQSVTIEGVQYVGRKMSPKLYYIYDYESFMDAKKTPGMEPRWIGTLELLPNGNKKFTPLAS